MPDLTPAEQWTADLLAEHRFEESPWKCRCGWRPYSLSWPSATREHRAHVARALAGDQTQPATTLTDDERAGLAQAWSWWRSTGDPEAFHDLLDDAVARRAARHAPAADHTATLDRVTAERDEFFARLTGREREHAERLARDANDGDTGVCRTCVQPITYTTVSEPGYNDRAGWSDGARRDALVCFKSVNYQHVPLIGRERGIWDAATRATRAALDGDPNGCGDPTCDDEHGGGA